MTAATRLALATLESRGCNLANENIFIGQRGAAQGFLRGCTAVHKVHEEWDDFVANLSARVGGEDAAEDGHQVRDTEIRCPAPFTGKSVERHLAHERNGVVEGSQERVNGVVVRVVVEETQTAAPQPGIRVGDGSVLHGGDGYFGDKLIALLVGQRVPPAEERADDVGLGVGPHHTIKHGFEAVRTVPKERRSAPSLSPQELPH
jgi:hypothetical protein